MNYNHAPQIIEGFDAVHEIEKFATIIESDKNLIISPSENILLKESSTAAEQARSFFNIQLLKKIFFYLIIFFLFHFDIKIFSIASIKQPLVGYHLPRR